MFGFGDSGVERISWRLRKQMDRGKKIEYSGIRELTLIILESCELATDLR